MILAIDMAPQASMGYVVPVQNIAEGMSASLTRMK